MTEDLIPQDNFLNSKQFEDTFFRRENYEKLREFAMDGYLGYLHNRFIA